MTWFFVTLGAVLILFVIILAHLYTSTKAEMKARLQAQKHQLTNNIAHEIRTPVASIRGYLETLVESPDMDEEHKRLFIERAYSQTLRLSELIRDISLITKMEQEPSGLPKEYFGVRKVIEDLEQEFRDRLHSLNITLINKVEEDVSVKANQALFTAIFRNLIENSMKYAGRDFTICISCTESGEGKTSFCYFDTGSGIDEKELPRIFERFYRVKGTNASEGSGLGLSIVKNAVEYHGGKISVKLHKPQGLEYNFYIK